MKQQQIKNNFFRTKDILNDIKKIPLDKKHLKILFEANKIFKKNGLKELALRSWKEQNDTETPAQFNLKSFFFYGFQEWLYRFLKFKVLRRRWGKFVLSSLLDDFDTIEKIGAKNILLKHPCDKEPGAKDAFFYQNTSINPRWLRYCYMAQRIISSNLLPKEGVVVEVGSYYGGLASLLMDFRPNLKIVLVDFYHQLIKAHAYLNKKFPNQHHTYLSNQKKYSEKSFSLGGFFYLPAINFTKNTILKSDLFINTFSFGEMHQKEFSKYFKSKVFSDSKSAYIVNRFVSGPWFEPTYEVPTSVKDYLSSDKKVHFFDIFPIHHNHITNKVLKDRTSFRTLSSSPYFELILVK